MSSRTLIKSWKPLVPTAYTSKLSRCFTYRNILNKPLIFSRTGAYRSLLEADFLPGKVQVEDLKGIGPKLVFRLFPGLKAGTFSALFS
jgi:hypothetical protein